MYGRKNIKNVLAVVFAAVLVTAFAYQASAYNSDIASYAYTGKVVDVDNVYGYVTVQAGSDTTHSFKLDDHATVTKCDKFGSLNDLKPGDMVTVYYFKENLGGRLIASEIDMTAYGTKSC